ncbi:MULTISPECIES: NAD(P)-binding domain-containing protein [Amycolatopsis]|uniref:NAD(P)-binding domain-containing protein n=1 Tax=Amycolatopsis albidoflavus TaxID=102226 RepID=A0ABW5I0R2_9PSEU
MSAPEALVFEVLVIGTGFGGLCAAVKLREAGIDNFVVLEKADDVGGTWRENTYPGAACDVMSLMYSFSFAPNPHWTRGYAQQPEILGYLRGVADAYDLRRSIVFGAEVVSQIFDDDTDTWTVRTASRGTFTARSIISGTGPLHIPSVPDLPGVERFAGTAFHSSQWDHEFDFAGKRVAVIGTGASAVQFIPEVAKQAGHLSVFQRTPNWCLPKFDRSIGLAERTAYRAIPGLRRLVRAGIYFSHEAATAAFLNPKYMPILRRVAQWHLDRQVPDPALRAKLRPDYEMGCKRTVMDNGYFPALQRDNVDLVTEPIREVAEDGVITADGSRHPVDAIVYGTGFKVTDAAADLVLTGRNGRTIQDLWADGPEGYLGVAAHGLPNYFTLVGPNTGVGNQSIVFIIEAQVRYIVQLLAAMNRREHTRVEVKAHVQAQFNRQLQRKSEGTVWTAGGCSSWYLDANGVNRAIWPETTLAYWKRTRTANLGDFEFSRLGDREEDEDYSGPAELIAQDGTRHPVQIHVQATYEPVENTIRWYGRVAPSPRLTELHVRNNLPVQLRIEDNEPVDGLLVDVDPWGGSRIHGRGAYPYPPPMDAELDLLFSLPSPAEHGDPDA